ncbi:hypothetical protein B0H13DRAFT_2403854 [Mycena leptocephala]|nr:hypothetical protein B0H13DRAFT_2403854 [Mycena leptocephala]
MSKMRFRNDSVCEDAESDPEDPSSSGPVANEAVTLLAQVEQILIEVDDIGDARTVPIRTIRELLQTGPLVSAQQRVKNVVHGLHGLVRQEAMLSRLSAASLDNPEKCLLYEQVPNPVYKLKFMPAYLLNVFRNTRPARQPGLIYEATVDRLAGAFFGFYLPPSHQFLLQPQHTFRALAPEDVVAMEAEWSRVVAPGDGSSRLDISNEPAFRFSPGASSTPRRGGGAAPSIATPPVEGASALPSSAGFDILERMVDLARDSLRRPDISVIYQGVSAVFSIPPQSATSQWLLLEWVQRMQRVYDKAPRVSAGKSLPTAHRRVRATVPRRTPSQSRRLHLMTVTAQYARQTDFHAPPFRRTPSHDVAMKSCGPDDHGLGWKAVLQGLRDSRCAYFSLYFSPSSFTAEKAGGGAKWAYLSPPRANRARPFRRVALRCCSAPSRAPRGLLRLHIRAAPVLRRRESSSHCVYADCLPALRTHSASIIRALLLPSIFADDLVGIPFSLTSSTTEYTRAYLPPSTPRSLIPARSQFMASYQ